MSAPVRLQTSVWNPLGERRALLIHGLSSDGGSWWRIASALAEEGWLVVAPDLRSHGRSPSGVDHGMCTLTGDVSLLGDGWDLVVGHSLGGSIGAVLAAQQAVQAMVLIDPVLHLPAIDREPLRATIKESLERADLASIRAANPRWSERDIQRRALAVAAMTPDVIDAVFDDNDPWDVRWAASQWSGRVHLMAADPLCGGLLAADGLAELTRVDGDRITGAVAVGHGHSIHRENPGLLLEAVHRLTSGT